MAAEWTGWYFHSRASITSEWPQWRGHLSGFQPWRRSTAVWWKRSGVVWQFTIFIWKCWGSMKRLIQHPNASLGKMHFHPKPQYSWFSLTCWILFLSQGWSSPTDIYSDLNLNRTLWSITLEMQRVFKDKTLWARLCGQKHAGIE